jgi:hypothetical protein
MSDKVNTAFGEADIPALVRAYESAKRADARKKQWLKTEKGREWNRNQAKNYYEAHKAEILERRRATYIENRDVLLARAKAYHLRKKEEKEAGTA